ncbi:hypothetical protein V474_07660 [Novosphingobium barchaimii LL02]|uniref:Uncharacterized protein n=2 Tax=Novosphingobium barchaimii TaxID=1420591 RepID=A0A0J8B0P5_9SPHN|nr:hypothetical protein V474_07660 [Novosphingobium barchaimii LL02]
MRVKRNGVTEIDPFTNMGRIIGRVSTNGANGSVTDDGLLSGAVEWQITIINVPPSSGFAAPSVSVSGNVLTWTYQTAGTWIPCIITYWVR